MAGRIYYTKPSITGLEIGLATDAVTHGWGERCYEYIEKFETAFSEHLGVPYALATSSCTGALHMGLAALGIGPGDEVILGEINWIATAAPVVHLGARPVLVDVLEQSWCLDPDEVRKAITPRTRAIIATHVYGNLCDMQALQRVADAHGLALIEDAAEALGSSIAGRRAGSMGAFGTFSFHGSKTITTGEGGMFVTQDRELYERVRTLGNHGRARGEKRQFWPERVGFKYKISNVQAAIGFAQVQRIDELLARKRWIFAEYRAHLADLPVRLNPEAEGTVNGCWMPTVVVNREILFDRDRAVAHFADEGIDARVFFWPLSMLGLFPRERENPVSYGLYPRALNLPSYHDIEEEDIARAARTFRRCLE